MDDNDLSVTRASGVLTLRLNRPRARNAMNWTIRRGLHEELAAAGDDPEIRVIVIRGDERAFSSGGDIGEMGRGAEDSAAKLTMSGEIVQRIAALPQPVIAAVQGHAAGAGIGLALACDLVYASSTALFSPSFVLRGLGPDMSGSYWLPRQVGLHRAKQILLSAAPITASEALALGLASEVWDADDYERLLDERVATFAAGPTLAYAAIKRLLNASLENTLTQQLDAERDEQSVVSTSADHLEALEAFAQKRRPRFSGR